MKIFLSFILLVMSNLCFSLSVESSITTLTPEDLFDHADLIAVIEVRSGSYNDGSATYLLSGEVRFAVKGSSKRKIRFSDNGFWENANKLSGTYLVFLERKNGRYTRVKSSQSIIEVNFLDAKDIAGAEEVADELGVDINSTHLINGDLWLVSSCIKKLTYCPEFTSAFKYALNKLK